MPENVNCLQSSVLNVSFTSDEDVDDEAERHCLRVSPSCAGKGGAISFMPRQVFVLFDIFLPNHSVSSLPLSSRTHKQAPHVVTKESLSIHPHNFRWKAGRKHSHTHTNTRGRVVWCVQLSLQVGRCSRLSILAAKGERRNRRYRREIDDDETEWFGLFSSSPAKKIISSVAGCITRWPISISI